MGFSGSLVFALSNGRWSALSVSIQGGAASLPGSIEALAAELSQPIGAAYVVDSDVAAFVFAMPSGATAVALINVEMAQEYAETARLLSLMHDGGWKPAAQASRLEAWARSAGLRPDVTALLESLSADWTNADDAILTVLAALGAPAPEPEPSPALRGFSEAIALSDSGFSWDGPTKIDLSRQRYIFGFGNGFVGVWDKEVPGGPIARFEDTQSGREQALARWVELIRGSR